jgi:membrane-bound metal-dependent hydrolase YbcI (DUF457 family)
MCNRQGGGVSERPAEAGLRGAAGWRGGHRSNWTRQGFGGFGHLAVRTPDRPLGWRMARWLAVCLGASALVVAAADAAFHVLTPSLPVAGLLDEPAHAATTIIILGALGWPTGRGFMLGAVVASVAIDLDHIPQYLGWHLLTAGTPRPYPHSFTTLLAVALVALLGRGRIRSIALGVELGLIGHFFRDMAEPSSRAGIALFWPISDVNVRVPYAAYAGVMATLLAVGLWRLAITVHPADRAPPRPV